MNDDDRPVVVVTGAAAGMGRAHAIGLAGAGFLVVALDRDEEGLGTLSYATAETGSRINTACVDVTDETAVAEVFKAIDANAGRIDALVNNAGAATALQPLKDTTLAAWEADLRLNLTSQFLCIRAALPIMMRRQAGSIVNIVTSSAFSGTTAALYRSSRLVNLVPYVAAKAGVIGMTRALAREVGSSGIRVNAVAPGFTPTPRVEAAFPGSTISRMVEDQAIRRVQLAGDVTGAVIFLASQASGAITGQVIRVDLGASMG